MPRDATGGVELTPRLYRVIDTTTKLAGVGLVALALELGPDSRFGPVVAVCGVAIATATVFITQP